MTRATVNLDVDDLERFRAATSASFVPLSLEAARRRPFRGHIRANGADGIELAELQATAHRVSRTPELIATASPRTYKLSLMLAGEGLLIQDDREALLRPGTLALYDTQRPYTLIFEDDFTALVMMIPHDRIELPHAIVHQLVAAPISCVDGVGDIVAPFLYGLAANLDELGGPIGARLAHSATNLLSTMMMAELGHRTSDLDPATAQLRGVLAFIDGHLATTDLSPALIAAANFMSVRQLHHLFRNQGLTVSEWIRTQRLEHCRQDLLDPAYRFSSVHSIAARWGFVDAPHFSRLFKAEFGCSPRQVHLGDVTPPPR